MANEIPIICVTTKCNQRCIFCSRKTVWSEYSPERIKGIIAAYKDCVCFEGGEPTLAPDVFKWIAHAKRAKVRDILLVTNGTNLEKPDFAEKFLKAGVTLFNVNLPAHDAAIYDTITQTNGNFEKRVAAVKNLIRIAGPRRVRITLVVNSIILKHMPDYARFIVREFPGLFYIEINFLKILGHCASRTWLVPTLTQAEPYLKKTFKILSDNGVAFLTDGFPLCFLKGYEHRLIDAHNLSGGIEAFFQKEKAHFPPCGKCSLVKICPGPRSDYTALHGWGELRPLKIKPGTIASRFEKKRRR